jgi:hypothetical protein
VRDLERRLLLFAARTVASLRPLRDPRKLVPAVARGAVAALRWTVRNAVQLPLLLGGSLAGALAVAARRVGRATVRAYRGIDFRAVGRAVLMAGAVAGAVLLIDADLSTLRRITVVTVVRENVRGGSEHFFALAVLGAAALPLAWGAAAGHSRPAMRVLAAIGLAALVVALAVDLPRLHDTGGVGQRFDGVTGAAGPGFARELGGAALLLVSGLGLLRLTPRPRRRARRADRGEMAVGTPPTAPAA